MPRVSVWDKNGILQSFLTASDEKIQELRDKGFYITPPYEGVDADSQRFDFELSKVVDLEESPALFEENKISNLPEDSFVIVNGNKYTPNEKGEIFFQGSELLNEEVTVQVWNKVHQNFEGKLVLTPEATKGHVLEQDYAIIRQGAYPSEREQIGALVKAVEALKKGKEIPADATAVFDLVAQVKSNTPKGEV